VRALNSLTLFLNLEYDKIADEITAFIKKTVNAAYAKGVIIGLSGGLDSSVVASLCVRSLGKEKVLGVLMPAEFTPQNDTADAEELANQLSIQTELIPIQQISEVFFKKLGCDPKVSEQKIPAANILARIRMIMLYYYANLYGYLVVGTGDRSEMLIGYFTKYGDGGVDFMPISHLYKSQVRELAKHLSIPEKIVHKPSSPQLYQGHKLTDELPLDYDKLDLILFGFFDCKLSIYKISKLTGVSTEVVENILVRFAKSKHKRASPPVLKSKLINVSESKRQC
jgi:NAD+ synthase